mmetsp:Transcript_110390/g.317488  ORF Transcript_110390/g.317488 Transcript_110390/m.317488 type:complete len:212 (+) Transcript_110390:2-637(+)
MGFSGVVQRPAYGRLGGHRLAAFRGSGPDESRMDARRATRVPPSALVGHSEGRDCGQRRYRRGGDHVLVLTGFPQLRRRRLLQSAGQRPDRRLRARRRFEGDRRQLCTPETASAARGLPHLGRPIVGHPPIQAILCGPPLDARLRVEVRRAGLQPQSVLRGRGFRHSQRGLGTFCDTVGLHPPHARRPWTSSCRRAGTGGAHIVRADARWP